MGSLDTIPCDQCDGVMRPYLWVERPRDDGGGKGYQCDKCGRKFFLPRDTFVFTGDFDDLTKRKASDTTMTDRPTP